jgi:hypothetical protein
MYLTQAFNATLSLPRMSADALGNFTSPYKNCGKMSDITNLRFVSEGVKCANVQSCLVLVKDDAQVFYFIDKCYLICCK